MMLQLKKKQIQYNNSVDAINKKILNCGLYFVITSYAISSKWCEL